jgi:hypothetical protein
MGKRKAANFKIYRLTPALLLLAAMMGGFAEAAPRIHCENPVYQFGSVEAASTVETTFTIHNTGDEPLEVTKFRNCCGVASELNSMHIPPGSNVTLMVHFALEGRRGPQLKTIYLISNDPVESFYKIRLMGRAVTAQTSAAPGAMSNESVAAIEPASANSPSDSSVLVEYFYEPGCPECEKVRQTVFPALQQRFEGQYTLRLYDIGITSNFMKLVEYQHRLALSDNAPVSIIVNGRYAFGGFTAIEAGLLPQVKTSLEQGEIPDEQSVQSDSGELLAFRQQGFTLLAVLLAGLLDGINPCAISTLVFFMSLLAVSKVRNRQLILLGVSFALASFLTYTSLGFGLLRVLHLFAGFKLFRTAIEWGMTLVLLILAAFSFRDAVRFRKTGRAADVALQLSSGMKQRIHSVMRRGLGNSSIILGGLFIGAVVTALESVCTGQVYVPTLVLILKNSAFSESRAWLYLLSYNLMFVLPLTVVFIAVYFGLRTERLLAWSRKNVVLSKYLLAAFFILMAALIVVF